jgi:two-component system, response regulator PdtaR
MQCADEMAYIFFQPSHGGVDCRMSASPQTAKILLVEDDPLIASCIHANLIEAGFVVVGTVSSGMEALSLAASTKISLALVDIRLTGPLDGIELACLLRDRHSVPAIFLSGLSDADTYERARAATPLGFLQKPFRPSEVFNAIQMATLHEV